MAGSNAECVKSEKQSKYTPKTAWKPGQSGNPNGRPKKGWAWAELLEDVGEQVHKESGKKFKHLVSERLWVECANGNIGAIKELFNRMEGLPKQTMEVNGGFFSEQKLEIEEVPNAVEIKQETEADA